MDSNKENFYEGAEIWLDTDKLEKTSDFPFKRVKIFNKSN